MDLKKVNCSIIIVLMIFPLCLTNINVQHDGTNISNKVVRDDFQQKMEPNTEDVDYLITSRGTEFYVIVESEQLFEANIEYIVNVTIQVLAWGTDVDRIYDIFVDISLVWSGSYWNSTVAEIDEINTIGGYNYALYSVALNEGDFDPLDDNEEISMTLWYDLEITEGVVLASDPTSIASLAVFGVTYKNTPPTIVDGIYDFVLPPIYTAKGSKMGISVRTNADWKVDKAFTIIFTFAALSFPGDVDRFYDIDITLWFKADGYNYFVETDKEYEINEGYQISHYARVKFDDTVFGGLATGDGLFIGLWYDISFTEGVILGIDPTYSITDKYALDFSLTHEEDFVPTGVKVDHVLELKQQTTLSHLAQKSWIKNNDDIFLNFTLYFSFNVYLETNHTVDLDSFCPVEVSTTNPFKLYHELVTNNVDVSIGAKPILGCKIFWIDKLDSSEHSFEVTDLPVPTPTDVDGDGSSITILTKTIYLWDQYIWTNGSLTDTFGKIIHVQDGITIDVFDIDLIQYIGKIFPEILVVDWLLDLNLVLAINIYPIIYQLFFMSYTHTASSMTIDDSGYYGFRDRDTTDDFNVDLLATTAITPDTDSSWTIEITPGVYSYSYSEIHGSIDIELTILGFSVFRFPLINFASDEEDSVTYSTYPSETYTRLISNSAPQPTTTAPSPTPTPTPSPTPTPTESPSETVTPTPTPTAGIGLLIAVMSAMIVLPFVIFLRKKRR